MGTLIKEYINLFFYLIKNPKDIFSSIWTVLTFRLLSKSKKEEIRKRRSICNKCPFLSTNYKKLGVYDNKRKDEHCVHCKCNKFLKTACLNCNCGIESHNKLVTNNNDKLPLRWTKWTKLNNK